MIELVNTSVPNGLIAGTHGFATVAMTRGTPDSLRVKLETLCAYSHRTSAHDASYFEENPVNWFHVVLPGGDSVVGRVAPCDFDYTGRTNRIARLRCFKHGELPHDEAASALLRDCNWFKEGWSGEPRYLEPGSLSAGNGGTAVGTDVWRRHFGSRGDELAKGIARQLEKNISRGSGTIWFKTSPAWDASGEKLLALFAEVIGLLPAELRPQATFSTYSAALPGGTRCCLRGIHDEDKAFVSAKETSVWVDCANCIVANAELLPAPKETTISSKEILGSGPQQEESPRLNIKTAPARLNTRDVLRISSYRNNQGRKLFWVIIIGSALVVAVFCGFLLLTLKDTTCKLPKEISEESVQIASPQEYPVDADRAECCSAMKAINRLQERVESLPEKIRGIGELKERKRKIEEIFAVMDKEIQRIADIKRRLDDAVSKPGAYSNTSGIAETSVKVAELLKKAESKRTSVRKILEETERQIKNAESEDEKKSKKKESAGKAEAEKKETPKEKEKPAEKKDRFPTVGNVRKGKPKSHEKIRGEKSEAEYFSVWGYDAKSGELICRKAMWKVQKNPLYQQSQDNKLIVPGDSKVEKDVNADKDKLDVFFGAPLVVWVHDGVAFYDWDAITRRDEKLFEKGDVANLRKICFGGDSEVYGTWEKAKGKVTYRISWESSGLFFDIDKDDLEIGRAIEEINAKNSKGNQAEKKELDEKWSALNHKKKSFEKKVGELEPKYKDFQKVVESIKEIEEGKKELKEELKKTKLIAKRKRIEDGLDDEKSGRKEKLKDLENRKKELSKVAKEYEEAQQDIKDIEKKMAANRQRYSDIEKRTRKISQEEVRMWGFRVEVVDSDARGALQ